MPFKSEKQRRYLWANEPEIARDWTDTYGSRIEKNDGGITQLVQSSGDGKRPGYRGDDARKSAAKMGKGHMGTARHGPAPGSHHPPGPVSKPDPTPTVRHHSGDDDTEAKKLNITRERDAVIRRLRDDKKAEATEKLVAKYARHKDKPSFVPSYLKALGPMAYLPGHKAKAIADRRAYAHSVGLGEWIDSLSDDEVISTDMMNFLAYSDAVPEGETYGDYMADRGSPGILHSGNVGGLNKYVKTRDEFGKPLTYGYSGAGGEGLGGGYMGYPSYAAWQAAQGQGGTTEVAEVVEEDVPSNFQPVSMAQLPYPNYPLLADGGRIGRAYGGIMDSSTGRRAYGFGSIFSKIGKAAKKVFKSPIGKAALIGAGAYFMPGIGAKAAGGWGNMFSNLKTAAQSKKWLGNMLLNKEGGWSLGKLGIMGASALPFFMGGQDEDEDEGFDYEGAKNKYWDELMRIKAGAMAGTLDPTKFRYQGVKDGGRIGLQEGGDPLLREEYDKYVFEMKEMGLQPMSFEEFLAQARSGMYAGGQSTPSDYTMEDAMMTTTQDKLGGITDVMKQADLNRQGSVGQFYAADGGRIGYAMGSNKTAWGMDTARKSWDKLGTNSKLGYVDFVDFFLNGPWGSNQYRTGSDKLAEGGRIGYQGGGETGHPPVTMGQVPQVPPQMPAPQVPYSPMPAPQPNRMAMNPMMNPMMGGRRMAQEGGLMDLGGMEKDYRNDGGFVPLGGEEKADDVPARLSKNEFVFTADAVRGAGDGDIDKGAEIMENIMKNLEQGGQVSEETQGLAGAQEMFSVSERLSEVV